MAAFRFFPLDITYKVVNGAPRIYLFGKTADGQRMCVVDDSFPPYFYVIPKAGVAVNEKLTKIVLEEEGTKFLVTKVVPVTKKYLENERVCLQVFTNIPGAVSKIRDIVKTWDNVEAVLEADILYVRRYLIDRGIIPFSQLLVDGEPAQEKLRIPAIKANSIKSEGDVSLTNPRILGIDIETYNPAGAEINMEKYPILMVALHGDNFAKVITWKQFETDDKTIEFVRSEADLIQRTKELIEEYKADIITGYYSDGFDMPYIVTRAKKYKIPLDIGLDYCELKVSTKGQQSVQSTGMVHVDSYKFIKKILARGLKTDSFTLNAVASELLGEKKNDVAVENLAKSWDNNEGLEAFCKYNLQDAALAHKLLLKVLPNIIEMVKIVGVPLHDITRMGFSQFVEWYIIRQAFIAGEIAPNKPDYRAQQQRMMKRIKGAFVFEPIPGFYRNIAVFDYRSLYPSIIASHNISVGTTNCNCCRGIEKVPDSNLWQCTRKKGFLSGIIEDIISRRARIKDIMKKGDKDPLLSARSEALKVLANSFYGYLAFAPARWYSFESAEATTAWGRHHIKQVIAKANEQQFKVLYSDTDSVFLELVNKTKDDALHFVEDINKDLPGMMELDFENFYPAGIFVAVKDSEAGAKKRYALLDEKGELKIRGFETVRRNTSIIAKEAQRNVLDLMLKQGNAQEALAYIKNIISDLKNNKVPIEKVTIRTQLQRNIANYESFGPHVAAAQRMQNKGMIVGPGSPIKFVIVKGEGKIRDKVKLPEEIEQSDYDPEYYIDHQVVPAVERLFSVFGITAEAILGKGNQSKLESFG